MLTSEQAVTLLGKRVVLTCASEVSYVGVVSETPAFHARTGILLELDSRSHLSIWCPNDFVKEVVVVPIDPHCANRAARPELSVLSAD
jgi:hypothetical protein